MKRGQIFVVASWALLAAATGCANRPASPPDDAALASRVDREVKAAEAAIAGAAQGDWPAYQAALEGQRGRLEKAVADCEAATPPSAELSAQCFWNRARANALLADLAPDGGVAASRLMALPGLASEVCSIPAADNLCNAIKSLAVTAAPRDAARNLMAATAAPGPVDAGSVTSHMRALAADFAALPAGSLPARAAPFLKNSACQLNTARLVLELRISDVPARSTFLDAAEAAAAQAAIALSLPLTDEGRQVCETAPESQTCKRRRVGALSTACPPPVTPGLSLGTGGS